MQHPQGPETTHDGYLPPRNEVEKQDFIKNGKPLLFAPPNGDLDSDVARGEDRKRRTIQAKWLNELATEFERKVQVPVNISHAVIEGQLQLQYVTFEYGISITNCELKDDVDFSFATFKRAAVFNDTKFEGRVNFRGAHARGDLEFVKARFQDCPHPDELHDDHVFRTNFQDVRVDHVFCADGAWFGCVNFKRGSFSKSILFRPVVVADAPGAKPEPVPTCFTGEADFSDSYVGGPAFLNGADFEQKVVFSRVHFASVADFRCYAQNGYLIRTHFRGETRFVSTKIDGSATFQGGRFDGRVTFDSTEVSGNLYFHYLEIDDAIMIERIRDPGEKPQNINALAPQFLSVRFLERASFFAIHVGASLTFVAAEFQGDADFELMRVDGHALFRSFSKNNVFANTSFGKTARFFHAQVKGNLEFSGAKFTGPAIFEMMESALVSFRPHHVEAQEPLHSTFHSKATFVGMRVNGEAQFSGTEFKDEVTFEGIQIVGNAVFDALIHEMQINPSDYPQCNPVKFARLANFNNSNFKQDANFAKAKFLQKADFTRATAEGEACFRGAEFVGDVSFNNARFSSVLFRDGASDFDPLNEGVEDPAVAQMPPANKSSIVQRVATKARSLWGNVRDAISRVKRLRAASGSYKTQFRGTLDLRGFIYERIEVNLDELLGDKIRPYDRQPYAQLEKTYRGVGDDGSVDKIYVKVRSCERKRFGQRVLADIRALRLWKAMRALPYWGVDVLHWGLTRYGTLPVMLLIISFIFLGTGAIVFSRKGAVKYKDKVDELSLRPPKLDGWSALGLSCNQFVPIVDVPSGSNYKPSDNPLLGAHITYATYGTVHRVAGVVLVPTGIAALTLLLYRRGKSGD